MLIKTQYLDEDSLTNYVAIIEGGLRESGSLRSAGSKGLGGSLGVNAAKVEGRRESETESTVTTRDHVASRLQRLITAGRANPEELGWNQVSQPDMDFPNLGTGALLEWECDVYIPQMISAMSDVDGFGANLQTFKKMLPMAETLGLDKTGIPDVEQMEAMAGFMSHLDGTPVVVGEDSDTDWQIVGSLVERWVSPTASFDDRALVIAKVKKRVAKDRWYPMMSLPGMNLLSREERRLRERKGPADASEESLYLKGPLLVVDYLAIYT